MNEPDTEPLGAQQDGDGWGDNGCGSHWRAWDTVSVEV